MSARRIATVVLAGVVGLLALLLAAGLFLPRGHRASRTLEYAAPPPAVFAAITDVERFPEWRPDVARVEVLPDDGGGLRFREDGEHGVVTYRVEAREADRRLVTRIDDPSLPFAGTWTFELRPAAKGTSLTITEDGEIRNPLFRVLAKLFFSPTETIEAYQRNLERRLAPR